MKTIVTAFGMILWASREGARLKEEGVPVEFIRAEGTTHSNFGKDTNQIILQVAEHMKKALRVD